MKYTKPLLALICIALLACDSTIDPIAAADGVVLSSIRHENGDQSWVQHFNYDGAGKLISIADDRDYGRVQEFFYQGDRLLEVHHVDAEENQLIFKDSMGYNPDGVLERIYNFSINQGPDVPLSNITYLTYDNQGLLYERNTVYERDTDYNPRDIHYWQNGNVIQVDRFNGDNKTQEFYYTYDDKPAVPLHDWQFTGLRYVDTQNNIVSTDWTDYSGLLDTACKPCTSTYSYYSNGLPASYTTNWGYRLTFEYKELPQTTVE